MEQEGRKEAKKEGKEERKKRKEAKERRKKEEKKKEKERERKKEREKEKVSLWTVGSKLYENPSEGFSCSSCKWGSALSLWLIIHYPMRYSDLSTSSLDQHTWIENKKEIHNLYFTKYS